MAEDFKWNTKFEFFKDIRFLVINGERWFVGKDVAKTLGYTNPNEAIIEAAERKEIQTLDSVRRPAVNSSYTKK